jgi:nitrite reductase (NADH) small subunit
MSDNQMNNNTPAWHVVCGVDEVPRMGGRLVRAGATQIALFRLSNGDIRAINNICPHKQGPLAEGIVSNDSIICPLHARKIDLESGQVLPPDSGCVETYATKIEDGNVLIQF